MDTSRAYKNGRANPNHLFEIFGHFSGHDAMEVCEVSLEHIARNLDFEHFSGHDAMEVREVLLEHIARNLDFHVKCSTVCLEMRNTCFSDWVKQLADGRTYCDELGLLSLSALYHRHTLVVTSNKLWSTI